MLTTFITNDLFPIVSLLPMTACPNGPDGFMSDADSEYYTPDKSITASSQLDDSHPASEGRLNGNKFWERKYDDTGPWIQAHLGHRVDVYGIQTQGGGDSWVTTLRVSVRRQDDFITDEIGDVKVGVKCRQMTRNYTSITYRPK